MEEKVLTKKSSVKKPVDKKEEKPNEEAVITKVENKKPNRKVAVVY